MCGCVILNMVLVEVDVREDEFTSIEDDSWGVNKFWCKVKVWDYILKDVCEEMLIGVWVSVCGILGMGDRNC